MSSTDPREEAPPPSGQEPKIAPRAGATAASAPPRRSLFAIVTLVAAAIAMSLIVWRITKAWRIEYGGGPREPRPIPTTGAFGAPGDYARPAPPTAAPAAPAPPASE
ncbi:MAG: hypothetical protein R3F14_15100 [Polyangiaceae bacterium]